MPPKQDPAASGGADGDASRMDIDELAQNFCGNTLADKVALSISRAEAAFRLWEREVGAGSSAGGGERLDAARSGGVGHALKLIADGGGDRGQQVRGGREALAHGRRQGVQRGTAPPGRPCTRACRRMQQYSIARGHARPSRGVQSSRGVLLKALGAQSHGKAMRLLERRARQALNTERPATRGLISSACVHSRVLVGYKQMDVDFGLV